MLRKLRDEEFTIAIVGLEKAGKSTLGNALLKLMVLPEYSERCTYTTTEIKAGEHNIGEIIFYSVEEFENDFKKRLELLKWQGDMDFRSIDLEEFNDFWDGVAINDPATYHLHNGTTVEDIRAIVQGREVIQSLLGKSAKQFADDAINGSEFKRYITGIDGYYNSGAVIRSAHPYAVRKVNIQSANLVEFPNAIIYDVPGFDSPTSLHKEQTEEMLKRSDAIILVVNAGDTPNINGPQLEMLLKGKDEDGIMLYEKAFVFGNKIDKANNRQVALDNIAALKNDSANKYRIALEKHILAGSAKAYLEDNGIVSEDELRRGRVDVSSTLQEWDMSNGIDELKWALEEYYQEDRFGVIRKRSNIVLREAKKFLSELLLKTEAEGDKVVDASNRYVQRLTGDIARFSGVAKEIGRKWQGNINNPELLPFSHGVIDKVAELFPYLEAEDERLAVIERETLVDSANSYPATRIDSEIREQLQSQFMRNVVAYTRALTSEKAQEVNIELVNAFLAAVGVGEDNPNYGELQASVGETFSNILAANGWESYTFNSIVRRFTINLVENIIKTPFGNRERLDKILSSINDYKLLATFEQKADSFDSREALKGLFERMLLHQGIEDGEDTVEETMNNGELG